MAGPRLKQLTQPDSTSSITIGNPGTSADPGDIVAGDATRECRYNADVNALTLNGAAATISSDNTITISSTGALSLDSTTNAIQTNATSITADAALSVLTTGATALTLDAGGAAAVNVGTVNANAVNIAAAGITTALGENITGIGANAASWGVDQAPAVVDFAVSGTATGLIPAGAMVIGVSTRILTTISGGGATGYQVGDGIDVDRWGVRSSLVVGQITDPRDFTTNVLIFNNTASAADVVLTGEGGTPTAGTVRIVVTYMSLTAPTS